MVDSHAVQMTRAKLSFAQTIATPAPQHSPAAGSDTAAGEPRQDGH